MYRVPPQAIQSTAYISRGKKLGVVIGFAFCVMFAVFGLLGFVTQFFELRQSGLNWRIFLITGGSLAGGGFGIWKLSPFLRRLLDYTPRFGLIPPHVYNYPFDVRFLQAGWRVAFVREGVLQFFPDHMFIDGKKNNPWIALVVISLLIIVPLILFQVAVGIIPAIIVVRLFAQRKFVLHVPYQAIQNIAVKGNQITFETPTMPVPRIKFYVASVDGARLYNELQPRFPAAFGFAPMPMQPQV